jgi:hypothetical protein
VRNKLDQKWFLRFRVPRLGFLVGDKKEKNKNRGLSTSFLNSDRRFLGFSDKDKEGESISFGWELRSVIITTVSYCRTLEFSALGERERGIEGRERESWCARVFLSRVVVIVHIYRVF